MLAALGNPRQPLLGLETLAVKVHGVPTVVALAAVVGQGNVALAVAIAAPAPEILVFQMGDGHGDALVPDVIVGAEDRHQIARQVMHRVKIGLGRFALLHPGLVDVAEKGGVAVAYFQGVVVVVGQVKFLVHIRTPCGESG